MTTSIVFHGDPTCPHCYLGLSRFELARSEFPEGIFELATAPFQIAPDLPSNGLDFDQYLLARYGDQAKVAEAMLPISKGAEEDHISLALEKIKTMPNSLNAFRLLHIGREIGIDYPLFLEMQRSFFTLGLDLGRDEVLRSIAEKHDLDGRAILHYLSTDQGTEAVKAEIREHSKRGVHAVPLWVIGGTYVVKGVQSLNFWRNVIGEIDEKGRELARKILN